MFIHNVQPFSLQGRIKIFYYTNKQKLQPPQGGCNIHTLICQVENTICIDEGTSSQINKYAHTLPSVTSTSALSTFTFTEQGETEQDVTGTIPNTTRPLQNLTSRYLTNV